MSPWRRCAATAWFETQIRCQGFFFECVRWQTSVFLPDAFVVVPPVEVEVVDAAPALCPLPGPLSWPLPLPGGGAAIANDATRPATKTAARRILSFMRGLLRGGRRPCRPRRSSRQKRARCGGKPPERVRAAWRGRPRLGTTGCYFTSTAA